MNSAATKIAGAAASLYLSNIVALALNTAYLVFLTNLASLQEVGLVTLLNILVVLCATLSVFALPITGGSIIGTPPAVTRFLPDYRVFPSSARKIISVSLLLCLIISVSFSFIVSQTGFSNYIAPESQRAVLDAASLDFVAYSLAQLGSYSLIGIGKTSLSVKLMIISNVVRYFLATVFFLFFLGLPGVFFGFTIGDLIAAVLGISLSFTSQHGKGYKEIDALRVLKYSTSVFVVSLTGIAVTQLDRIVAFLGKGFESLGVYNVAVIGASVVSFAPSAIINALVSYIPVYSREELPDLIRSYTRYVSIIGLPLGFAVASISKNLLLLFGQSYVSGATVLATVSITLSATSISSVFASGLLANDTSHYFTIANLTGVLFMLLSAYTLIPVWGIDGIGASRALMLVISFLLTYYFARKKGLGLSDWSTYAKCMLAGVVMGLLVFSLLDFFSSFFELSRIVDVLLAFLFLFIGFSFYLVEIKFLRILNEQDIEFVKLLLPERFLWIARILKKFI